MEEGFYRHNERQSPPAPPNVFFDGTRLGLEGTMIAALIVAIPAGLQSGLSATLGYLVRYAEMPAEPKAFSFGGLIWGWLLAALPICMILFFGGAIPTMLSNMGLVAYMLRWLRKRRGKDRLAATVAGAVLGLFSGIPCSALAMLVGGISPTFSLYTTLLRWPAILSVDGIFILWLTLLPFANAIAGARSGWKIGQLIEELQIYWFF